MSVCPHCGEVFAIPHASAYIESGMTTKDDMPGMWESADVEGGATDNEDVTLDNLLAEEVKPKPKTRAKKATS